LNSNTAIIFGAELSCHYTCRAISVMAGVDSNIRGVRAARGITQQELARRAGISRQALGAIESGLYQPSETAALSLARELGETVETLFADNDEQQCTRIEATWSDPEMVPVQSSACKVVLARVARKVVAVP